MTLNVPGLGLIPVRWVPSSDFTVGRAGFQPIAIVHHRAVANGLNSIDQTFLTSSRQVSAHFAIGDYRTPEGVTRLEVHQYVDLSDTAWCNGDCQARTYPDLPSNWDKWYGHKAHNERTVSIEHDDNGGLPAGDPRKGIVTEAIIRISIELDRLILGGDIAAIRAAGIRVKYQATVDALAKMPRDAQHLINHHDIAGKLKPTCWRPWAADTVGFPRQRYIDELTAVPAPQEDDVYPLSTPAIGYAAVVKLGMNVRSAPKMTASVLRVTSSFESWTVIGWVKGDVDDESGSDQWLMRFANGRYEFTAKVNLAKEPYDPTPYSKAELDGAVKAAVDPLQSKITSLSDQLVGEQTLAATVAQDLRAQADKLSA